MNEVKSVEPPAFLLTAGYSSLLVAVHISVGRLGPTS